MAFIFGFATNQFLAFDPTQYQAVIMRQRHLSDETDNNYDGPIKKIALLGERSSGTKWMYGELSRCFNETLKVRRGLTRDKHWFQYDDGNRHNKTIVVALFRNPYDWTSAMVDKPHHAPNHVNLPWYTFVKKPWIMPRAGRDLDIDPTDATTRTQRICQENFYYHEVVACHKYPFLADHPLNSTTLWNQNHPVYELRNDQSGLPYDSILDLRRDKIRNFLGVASFPWVEKVLPIRYEVALDQGTSYIIRKIEALTGVKAHCEPHPPQRREERPLNRKFAKYITKHSDWETEGLIGYGSATVTTSSA